MNPIRPATAAEFRVLRAVVFAADAPVEDSRQLDLLG